MRKISLKQIYMTIKVNLAFLIILLCQFLLLEFFLFTHTMFCLVTFFWTTVSSLQRRKNIQVRPK